MSDSSEAEFEKFLKEILLNTSELYKIETAILDILNDLETEQEIIDMFVEKFTSNTTLPESKKRKLSQLNISNEIEITHIEKKSKIDNYFKKTNKDATFKNIKEKINNKEINNDASPLIPVQSTINIHNTNTFITINQCNDTEDYKTRNLSDQKSTTYSNMSLTTVNNKPAEVKPNNFRGINSRLAGNILNFPKAKQEKNIIKKNSKNVIQKLFEGLDYKPIKVVDTNKQTNYIKEIVNKDFYIKPKREEECKYSVRNKTTGDTSLLNKYNHAIFKKNPKKDVSPARSDLSDDILVHKTPTRENQLKFVPDKMNFLKLLNQNKK
jgi:hypothetical protein